MDRFEGRAAVVTGAASGIGQALAGTLEETGLPVIVAAFVIATAIRVAQGSATLP